MTDAVCRNGHPQTEDVVYVSPNGRRSCKECNRWAVYRYRARLGERPGKPRPLNAHGSHRIGQDLATRFWAKVEKRERDQCWPWKTNTKKYGTIRVGSSTVTATHIALELAGKPRPSGEHHACHTCDNTVCVNPDHLWWGTASENMRDSIKKGRKPATYGNAKLNADDAAKIRSLAGILSNTEIAEMYGVSRSSINMIQLERTWTHA